MRAIPSWPTATHSLCVRRTRARRPLPKKDPRWLRHPCRIPAVLRARRQDRDCKGTVKHKVRSNARVLRLSEDHYLMRHSNHARKLFGLLVLLAKGLPAAGTPNLTMILGQPTDRSITVNTRSD